MQQFDSTTYLWAAASVLKVAPSEVFSRVTELLTEIRELEDILAITGPVNLDAHTEYVGQARLIVAEIPGATPLLIKGIVDQMRQHGPPTVVMLAAKHGKKVSLVASATDDLVAKGIKANRWIRYTAGIIGGDGGGHHCLAQGGGRQQSKLPKALGLARFHMLNKLGELQ